MKRKLLFLASIVLIMSCVKQSTDENPAEEKWNGYGKYLKAGEQYHTLWAGQNINVGTVTYGIDENANFYVTYDCSSSGWLMSETHMFAGDKRDMPLNKPGSPKVGRFPHSGYHNPKVSSYTYRVPLSQLPPCESPGFVVASHCVVHSPAGRKETAWAFGDYTFSDKGWGWYDDYYYNTPENPSVILYGTVYSGDSLKVYHLDMATGGATLILKEYVGNSSGSFDGAAYDNDSGIFFFIKYNTSELWVNLLLGEEPSFCAGNLDGAAASGTYFDGAYYYVDENPNTINKVIFNDNWTIAGEITLDTIPSLISVNDIAMSPEEGYLYILGQYEGGVTELIAWDIASHSFYTMSIPLNDGAQIAYGSDNVLYAIAPLVENENFYSAYSINTDNGILQEVIIDTSIIIEDSFTDLASGPGW